MAAAPLPTTLTTGTADLGETLVSRCRSRPRRSMCMRRVRHETGSSMCITPQLEFADPPFSVLSTYYAPSDAPSRSQPMRRRTTSSAWSITWCKLCLESRVLTSPPHSPKHEVLYGPLCARTCTAFSARKASVQRERLMAPWNRGRVPLRGYAAIGHGTGGHEKQWNRT